MPTIQLPADMPSRMRRLPRDEVGRPVPFFAAEVDGVHDFRLMDGRKLVQAVREQLCWVCGERLLRARASNGPRGTFVAGPMCLVNRTSAEPPSHSDCAEWSSKACPFLTKPAKERRETHLPENLKEAAGIAIMRNPGVTALISSQRWKTWSPQSELGVGGDGILFEFSRIDNVRWMSLGRNATAREVMTSIETGLPTLIQMAGLEDGGVRALAFKTRDALRWAPGGALADISDYPTTAELLRHLP